MSEKISQLIDQELDPSERNVVLDKICHHTSTGKSWQSYHLIGNILRSEVSSAGKDLSRQIQLKLEREPTVLTPLLTGPPEAAERKDVWRSVGLLAVAASLALVAVVTLSPSVFDKDVNQSITGNQLPGSKQTMRFSVEFDEMLVDHAEFTASSGLNGLMAYAKLVSDQQLEQ